MNMSGRIDLHMHTTFSDGTDTPREIVSRVRESGIALFAVTDHDSLEGCRIVRDLLTESDPAFLTGTEFSCRDEAGKYHILGYGFDPDAGSVQDVAAMGRAYRLHKTKTRIDYLQREFGMVFPEEALNELYAMENAGKPHIGNLMVRCGYARTRDEAIGQYINRIRFRQEYVRPEEAIRGILQAGGIPVLAHPAFGSGSQYITGEEMDGRLVRLMEFGLLGIEAFYFGFSKELCLEMLSFAKKYGLYVTAGSDYHGTNKVNGIGAAGLDLVEEVPEGLTRFLADTGHAELLV